METTLKKLVNHNMLIVEIRCGKCGKLFTHSYPIGWDELKDYLYEAYVMINAACDECGGSLLANAVPVDESDGIYKQLKYGE